MHIILRLHATEVHVCIWFKMQIKLRTTEKWSESTDSTKQISVDFVSDQERKGNKYSANENTLKNSVNLLCVV